MQNILYVGSNSGADKQSLRSFSFDSETGALQPLAVVADAVDAIYLAHSADGRFLYVAENVAALPQPPEGADKKPGGVSLFSLNGEGGMTRVASWALAPTVPCHISLSPDGTKLAWAEYRTARAGVALIDTATGHLDPAASVHHTGHGPNPERQEAAHCHFAAWDPDGSILRVCDLGLDRVFAYRYDDRDRTLRHVLPSADFVAPGGVGPRHLAWNAEGNIAYLVAELSSQVFPLVLDKRGAVRMTAALPMLPRDFTGFSKAAAIRVSPDGRWLLASNRGHDSIAAFKILDPAQGLLAAPVISKLDGEYPRDFVFAPDGKHLVVSHKMSNEFAVYDWDADTGTVSNPTPKADRPHFTKPLAFVF